MIRAGVHDEPAALPDASLDRIVRRCAGWKLAPWRVPTRNADAYAACQKGALLLKTPSAPHLKEAIEYFHKAIELDPEYAEACAGLAQARDSTCCALSRDFRR